MQTITSRPNTALRIAMLASAAQVDHAGRWEQAADVLLASTLRVPYRGPAEAHAQETPDGPVPHSFERVLQPDGTRDIVAFTDERAQRLHDRAADRTRPRSVATMSGEDLMRLAADEDCGLCINPGSTAQLWLGRRQVVELRRRMVEMRSAGRRVRVDSPTLLSMRPHPGRLPAPERRLLAAELAGRGARVAYLAEYALHEHGEQPREFTPVIVVGDTTGDADDLLREEARTVVSLVTGIDVHAADFSTFHGVVEVAPPILDARP